MADVIVTKKYNMVVTHTWFGFTDNGYTFEETDLIDLRAAILTAGIQAREEAKEFMHAKSITIPIYATDGLEDDMAAALEGSSRYLVVYNDRSHNFGKPMEIIANSDEEAHDQANYYKDKNKCKFVGYLKLAEGVTIESPSSINAARVASGIKREYEEILHSMGPCWFCKMKAFFKKLFHF